MTRTPHNLHSRGSSKFLNDLRKQIGQINRRRTPEATIPRWLLLMTGSLPKQSRVMSTGLNTSLRKEIIPSWVIFGMIILSTFMVNVTVNVRTSARLASAKASYEESQKRLDLLRHGVSEPINASTSNVETSVQAARQNRPLLRRLIVAIYSIILFITAFWILAATSRRQASRDWLGSLWAQVHLTLFSEDASENADYSESTLFDQRVVPSEHSVQALTRLAFLLFTGLVLAGGFIFAAKQHFAAVQYSFEIANINEQISRLSEVPVYKPQRTAEDRADYEIVIPLKDEPQPLPQNESNANVPTETFSLSNFLLQPFRDSKIILVLASFVGACFGLAVGLRQDRIMST